MGFSSPLLFSRQLLSSGPHRTSVLLARHLCHGAAPKLLPSPLVSSEKVLARKPRFPECGAKFFQLSLLQKPQDILLSRSAETAERSRSHVRQVLPAVRASSSDLASLGDKREDSVSLEDHERLNLSADLTAVGKQINYVVVNFYHFTEVTEPREEVAQHVEFVKDWDLKGRIFINEQGINAQLSGPQEEAVAYAEWVAARMPGLRFQVSPSPDGHAFPRLRLRYKPSLVQVSGGTQALPLTDASARAVPLSPREWRQRIEAANVVAPGGESSSGQMAQQQDAEGTARRVLLLDVRNGYEWDVGHFVGAERPEVDCFKETNFGIAAAPEPEGGSLKDPLAGVDREKTDILMYCTGGIRCDVYSTMLRERGFQNLYTLEGGIARYLKDQGSSLWAGNLFVFDSRLAVAPSDLHAGKGGTEDPSRDVSAESAAAQAQCEGAAERGSSSPDSGGSFVRCRMCGVALGGQGAKHRNCANTDCNELFLGCSDCVTSLKGCCCKECEVAPRLRPLVADSQYQRWHWYRDANKALEAGRKGPSQRALNKRRRREQRKLQEAQSKA